MYDMFFWSSCVDRKKSRWLNIVYETGHGSCKDEQLTIYRWMWMYRSACVWLGSLSHLRNCWVITLKLNPYFVMKNVALALRCGGDAFGSRGDCCGLWFGQGLKERGYCIHRESTELYSCVGYLSCSKPVVVAVEISRSSNERSRPTECSVFSLPSVKGSLICSYCLTTGYKNWQVWFHRLCNATQLMFCLFICLSVCLSFHSSFFSDCSLI